jgi:NAD(P)-dependent dehydrogenase (short-subunit alcohol dehydrogenase family)
VKLRGEDVIATNGSGHAVRPVTGRRPRELRIGRDRVIRVNEVKPGSDATGGLEVHITAVLELDLVPAHVGDLEPVASNEPLHLAPKPAEASNARRLLARFEQDLETHDETLLDELSQREAFGRAAEPWEVANVMVFLASDLSSYMTGEVVSVSSQHP